MKLYTASAHAQTHARTHNTPTHTQTEIGGATCLPQQVAIHSRHPRRQHSYTSWNLSGCHISFNLCCQQQVQQAGTLSPLTKKKGCFTSSMGSGARLQTRKPTHIAMNWVQSRKMTSAVHGSCASQTP
eukprot:1162059-Pelagomonas_calceolata.AAC.13